MRCQRALQGLMFFEIAMENGIKTRNQYFARTREQVHWSKKVFIYKLMLF